MSGYVEGERLLRLWYCLDPHICGLLGAVVKLNQPANGIYYATQISDAEAVASSLSAVSPQPEARINFGPVSFFGVLTVRIN